MNVQVRPLTVWRHPETRDRKSRYSFRAGWADTLSILEYEIYRLGGGNVIIGAFFRDVDIRQDGWPRSGARSPEHPGVELSFDSQHGRLVYATDEYESWENNVRAIALALRSLRAVDRYGVSKRGQQYAGWRALSSGAGVTSTEEAYAIIGSATDHPAEWVAGLDDATLRRLIRAAAKKTHPDAGGSAEAFRKVQVAKALLER